MVKINLMCIQFLCNYLFSQILYHVLYQQMWIGILQQKPLNLDFLLNPVLTEEMFLSKEIRVSVVVLFTFLSFSQNFILQHTTYTKGFITFCRLPGNIIIRPISTTIWPNTISIEYFIRSRFSRNTSCWTYYPYFFTRV